MMTAISMFSSNENILSLCNINNVNISNGLSHNGVTATMRDSRGYLWICTYDGLNQYNGFTVKIYKNTLSENLFNSNRIRCMQKMNMADYGLEPMKELQSLTMINISSIVYL